MKKPIRYTVEMRTHCKLCGKKITEKRYRTFCSQKCREKSTNIKHRAYTKEWQRNRIGKYEEGKIQCLICGRWYHQVCSHVWQVHNLNHRQYKEMIGKDIGIGLVTKKLFAVKRKQNLDNKDKVWKNLLESGKKFRYKKGSKRAGIYQRSKETLARLKGRMFAPHLTPYKHESD